MAICALCQRSSLVKLHLCNLGRFTSIDEFASLLASPALSDLSLMQLELPPQSEGENMPSRNRLSLTSCRLNLVRGHPTPTLDIIAPWLVHGGSLSHLRHLNVSWVPEHTPQLQRILNATMSSLQTLSLTLNQICTFPRSLHGFIVIIVIEFGYSHTVLLAEQSCAGEPDDAPFHQADIDAQCDANRGDDPLDDKLPALASTPQHPNGARSQGQPLHRCPPSGHSTADQLGAY